MSSKFTNLTKKTTAAVLISSFLTGLGYSHFTKDNDVEFTVEAKSTEGLRKSEGFGFYKDVYQTDIGKLESVVDPFQGKFFRNSIDLEVGKTYKGSINGLDSIGTVDLNRNILKATPVKKQP